MIIPVPNRISDDANNSRTNPLAAQNATVIPTMLLFLSLTDMINSIASKNNMLVSFR